MAERSPGEQSTMEEVSPPADVSPPDALDLAADFPAAERDRWQELVAAVLRKSGRTNLPDPVESALASSVTGGLDSAGIEICPPRVAPPLSTAPLYTAPLYTAQDAGDLPRSVGVPGLAPFVRGRRAGHDELTGWDVRARHAHPDVVVTRKAIADDLDNGVTSLWLVLGEGAVPVGALDEVLADVLLDVAPIVLQAGSATAQVAEGFFSLASAQGVEATQLAGNLGADPLGDGFRTGSRPDLSTAVALAAQCNEFASMRAIVVDGTAFHDAGAGTVEELALTLAAGVDYLRALSDGGFDVDSAFAALDFRYSAGVDQFLTIASLRAARRLWNRVGEGCDAAERVRGQSQHAVTSSVMMTRRDPWVNMLRTTVSCFAAGVGGADAITVSPFDSALGLPDSFARRIARNTQTLLMEEAHLSRVLDPAGGSWYVESLTDQLAAAAWEWFTEIERAGGMAAAMSTGLVAERIELAWAQRRARLARRTEVIIGVSEFPNLTEKLPERESAPSGTQVSAGLALPLVRAAEDFEVLRDRVDNLAAQHASRPAVFLAVLGSAAASAVRASFAGNLFQSGGLETPSNGSDDGQDSSIVSAFAESGTSVVCLCGTDEAYASRAEALIDRLIEAGATQIWISDSAGEGSWVRIDGHVFAGCDALAVLGAVLDGPSMLVELS
ncbi:MAG: methylmalonyl-CoA mutase subunit beta [Geodermatophilaceae bacterium]